MSKDFTQSFDARDWARAFVETLAAKPGIAADEGTMVSWFANAIMRGYDEHARRYPTDALVKAVLDFDAAPLSMKRFSPADAVWTEALALARPHIDPNCKEVRDAAVAL